MFYPNKKSFFLVRYLSSVEENILTDSLLMESEKGMEMVLDSLLIDDFNVKDLLSGDVQAISMFLRSTAYGDKIELNVHCPVCKHQDKIDYQISSFKMKDIQVVPTSEMLLVTELPVTKKIIKMRVPTFLEEFSLKGSSEGFIQKLIKVTKVLGDITDGRVIAGMIPKLPMLDSKHLRKFLEENTPGVQADIPHECTACGHSYVQKFRSDENFLNLPESYRERVMEERFLVSHYNQGGTNWVDTSLMPATERRWLINRISKELQEKKAATEKKVDKSTVKRRVR